MPPLSPRDPVQPALASCHPPPLELLCCPQTHSPGGTQRQHDSPTASTRTQSCGCKSQAGRNWPPARSISCRPQFWPLHTVPRPTLTARRPPPPGAPTGPPHLGAASQRAVGRAACRAVVQTLADPAGTPSPALPHAVDLAVLLAAFTGLRLAPGKWGPPLTW